MQTETEKGDRALDDPGDVDALGRTDLLDALDAAVASDADHEEDPGSEAGDPTDGEPGGGAARRRVLLVAGGLAAVAGLAVTGVVVAGSLGADDGPVALPQTVRDPAVVLTALEASGFDCSAASVSGELASCTSTITVRVFPDGATADAWAQDALASASSAIGWAVRGNVVVAAPLERTREIARVLGVDARIV